MERSRRILFATFTILLAAHASLARPPATLQADVAKILSRPSLRCAHVGVMVMSLPSGDVWFSSNPDRLFVPASNAKLFIAAALGRLGPDFRYETAVLAEREPQDGVLRGDLFLKGSGDPTLTFLHLAGLAERLRKKGLSHITGRVVGDESAFDSVRFGRGWMLEDLPWYYAPEISALSLNGNSVMVVVRPGPVPGVPPRVTISPPTSYLRIENQAMTQSGQLAMPIVIDRPFGLPLVAVHGGIRPGSRPAYQRVSVPDPALWAAHVFRERLLASGVRIDGEAAVGIASADMVALADHGSPPLYEIIGTMLKNSDNHMAEQLLKMLGGTAEHSLAAVDRFLRKAGVTSTCPPNIADGSGLSRYNLASPRHFAALLRFMDRHPHRSVWLEALPMPGIRAALNGRMMVAAGAGTVYAKTGTMFAVSALSGYASTRSGRRVCFSILVNNFVAPTAEIRQAQDDIVAAIARAR